MNYENAYKLLEEKGQLHLLKYYDTLSEAEQATLLNQISEIDFSLIDMIGHNSSGSDSDIAPVAALQMDSIAENMIYTRTQALKPSKLAIWHWSSWQVVRAPVLDSPVLREPSTSVSPRICLYSSFSSSTPSIL